MRTSTDHVNCEVTRGWMQKQRRFLYLSAFLLLGIQFTRQTVYSIGQQWTASDVSVVVSVSAEEEDPANKQI